MSPDELRRDVGEVRERLAVTEAELRTLRQFVEGVKTIGEMAIRNTERIGNLRDDLNEMANSVREQVDRAVQACSSLSEKVERLDRSLTVMETQQAAESKWNAARTTAVWGCVGVLGAGALLLVGKLLGVA